MTTNAEPCERRLEAVRLIEIARAKLISADEEIAAIYLDHALDALRAIHTECVP